MMEANLRQLIAAALERMDERRLRIVYAFVRGLWKEDARS